MTAKDHGGHAFPCSRCQQPSVLRQGRQWLCAKHYRFGQMRTTAKRRGLAVPSHQELEALVHPEMHCADCNGVMNWLGRDGQTFVATFQHYRDGTFGIVCRSCNTRHAFAPGDTYRDAPKDHKFCPQCEQVKPLTEYCADNSRSGPMKVKSTCRSCASAAHADWQRCNRDHYNATQRAGRARRKADAMLRERAK